MSTKCVLIRLKPNTLEKVRSWALMLNDRASEVYQTLEDEGITLESVFLACIDHKDFLIYVMRSEDFDKASEVAKQSIHSIDAYHRQFKADTWLERVELENLIDFSR